jgi:hypothetical protein
VTHTYNPNTLEAEAEDRYLRSAWTTWWDPVSKKILSKKKCFSSTRFLINPLIINNHNNIVTTPLKGVASSSDSILSQWLRILLCLYWMSFFFYFTMNYTPMYSLINDSRWTFLDHFPESDHSEPPGPLYAPSLLLTVNYDILKGQCNMVIIDLMTLHCIWGATLVQEGTNLLGIVAYACKSQHQGGWGRRIASLRPAWAA